jgi:hypothetical protein
VGIDRGALRDNHGFVDNHTLSHVEYALRERSTCPDQAGHSLGRHRRRQGWEGAVAGRVPADGAPGSVWMPPRRHHDPERTDGRVLSQPSRVGLSRERIGPDGAAALKERFYSHGQGHFIYVRVHLRLVLTKNRRRRKRHARTFLISPGSGG